MKVVLTLRLHLMLASLFLLVLSQLLNAAPASRHAGDSISPPVVETNANSATAETGGIREVIDKQYKARYEEWKSEFLSTDIARTPPSKFSINPPLFLPFFSARTNFTESTTP